MSLLLRNEEFEIKDDDLPLLEKALENAISRGIELMCGNEALKDIKSELEVFTQLLTDEYSSIDENCKLERLFSHSKIQNLKRLFKSKRCVASILPNLLDGFLANWSCVVASETELENLVKIWILKAPPLDVIMSISQVIELLSRRTHDLDSNSKSDLFALQVEVLSLPIHVKTFIETIEDYFNLMGRQQTDRWIEVIDEISQLKNPQNFWTNLLNVYAGIPVQIANLAKSKLPSHWSVACFFNMTFQQAIKYVSVRPHLFANDFSYIAILISKINSVGYLNSTLAPMEILMESEMDKPKFSFLRHTLQLVPQLCLERICYSFFRKKSINNFLLFLETSDSLIYLLTQKFPVSYVLPTSNLQLLFDKFHSLPCRDRWLETVLILSKTFADQCFILESPYNLQLQLTKLLCYLCDKYLTKEDLESTQLLLSFMHGIQAHMVSPDTSIFNLGLILGQSLTARIDPENQIKFEGQIPEDDEETLYEHDDSAPDLKNVNSAFQQVPAYDDPDEDFLENLENHTAITTCSQSSNVPGVFSNNVYTPRIDSKDDIRDLTKVAVPVYLRESLINLQSKDQPDLLEVTIQALPDIIYSLPEDLEQVSTKLTFSLIHQSNQYELPNFELHKRRALVALSECDTQRVVTCLARIFYDVNCSLYERNEILQTLIETAKKISSPQNAAKCNTQTSNKTNLNFKTSTANMLAVHIDSFFEILRGHKKPTKNFNIFTSDDKLLGHLIFTIGTFIECVGVSCSDLLQILKETLDFVWIVRHHRQPHVHKAILLTIRAILNVVPIWMLFEQLLAQTKQIFSYIEQFEYNNNLEEIEMLVLDLKLKLSKLVDENPSYKHFV